MPPERVHATVRHRVTKLMKYHPAMANFKLGEMSRGRPILARVPEANADLPEAARAALLALSSSK